MRPYEATTLFNVFCHKNSILCDKRYPREKEGEKRGPAAAL